MATAGRPTAVVAFAVRRIVTVLGKSVGRSLDLAAGLLDRAVIGAVATATGMTRQVATFICRILLAVCATKVSVIANLASGLHQGTSNIYRRTTSRRSVRIAIIVRVLGTILSLIKGSIGSAKRNEKQSSDLHCFRIIWRMLLRNTWVADL